VKLERVLGIGGDVVWRGGLLVLWWEIRLLCVECHQRWKFCQGIFDILISNLFKLNKR
jgi:hypothetical protein